MIYKRIESAKDEMDSQHLWAGSKIKNMYKNTKMIFQGGLVKRTSTNMDEPGSRKHSQST